MQLNATSTPTDSSNQLVLAVLQALVFVICEYVHAICGGQREVVSVIGWFFD